jgi:beta-N-acetylhexosaminidase
VRHAARAAAVLLATVVTLSCATTEPEAPGLDMRPSVPSGFAAPERPAQSGQQVTVPQPEAAPPTASETEAVASTDAGPAASQPAAAEPAETMPATMDPIEARIDELLATMTIEQKIGQRFMTWIPGTASSERAAALIEQAHVGGVIITEDNVESHQQARELIATLQRMAQAAPSAVPLFIATDQEGGRLTRVRLPELTLFPAAFHQGVHADTDYVEATAYVTGVELRRLGVNMNLAPLLDLYDQPDQTVIGNRSYGADSGLVADFARAYVRGASRSGIISVAKHFPGHGVTMIDSHDRLPVVRLTRSERSSILAPFIAAIDAGIDVIMSAHILYEDLDPDLPATVSPAIVTGLLRDQLAFDGVVMTDAVEIREPAPALMEPDIVHNSFVAGADIILTGRDRDVLPLVQEAIRLVRAGLESEERLDESVRRILRVKLQTMGR